MGLGINNFNDVMGMVDNFLGEISKSPAAVNASEHREMFQQLIANIRQYKQEAEVAVPRAYKSLADLKKDTQEKLEKFKAEAPERKARRAALVEKAKQVEAKREEDKKKLRAKPVKVNLSKVKMPPGWGDQLKDELLNKFGKLPAAPMSAPRDAAIWDDWQWNTEKPIGEG